MIESTLTVDKIDLLANFFLKNQTSMKNVIKSFGEIVSDNGHGTFFLKPINPLFKAFWVFIAAEKIQAVGMGGSGIALSLEEIYSEYPKYLDGFNIYDDQYEYVFHKNGEYTYTIKISLKEKALLNGIVVKNLNVNQLEIWLR
ncbi:MAG: hypothetical protein ACHQHN_04230 [Sphingobacteriales bacterium]